MAILLNLVKVVGYCRPTHDNSTGRQRGNSGKLGCAAGVPDHQVSKKQAKGPSINFNVHHNPNNVRIDSDPLPLP